MKDFLRGSVAVILAAALCLCIGCCAIKEAPKAGFSAAKNLVAVGQEVHFTDQSSGNPEQWSWNFGDGNINTEQNPTHSYNAIGSYTVSLTVSNSAGTDAETREDYIQVTEALEKPTEDIKQALASQEGVSTEDVKILFCDPATLQCKSFATGAIVNDTKVVVFVYDTTTQQIAQEHTYIASTEDEISALSTAAKQTSKWTGNLIAPCDLTSADGKYDFKYYDGYYMVLSRWSFGWGMVDPDEKTVEWGDHV